ncbi:ATP-binding cassette domain-containing protein [Streptomyces sp. NPDC048420]|uniref:ATP-binding cassette domain-containing protein n=1 Tax=Streptomyces sp. NPDC048420 TaxID=3155755 RepID=UPI003412F5C3
MGRVIDRPIAETRNLTFTHAGDEQPSLRGLDIQFAPGEFVVLIGACGCGKSTLLRCLAGISPHLSTGEMEGAVLTEDVTQAVISQLSPELARV